MEEIYDTPTAEGSEVFEPKGHDIEFRNVSFAYDNGTLPREKVSKDLSQCLATARKTIWHLEGQNG